MRAADEMRTRLLSGDSARPALIFDDRSVCTYADLADSIRSVALQLGETRTLVLVQPDNSREAILTILGALCDGHVVMLIPPGQTEYEARVCEKYSPNWVFSRCDNVWTAKRHSSSELQLHEELALLLPTSGSTGASKFVRLSYENLLSNARSIVEYLEISSDDRGLLSLPVHYSYGLSILTSHLVAGASVLVTDKSFTEPDLWTFFRDCAGTSISGVPHSYELLLRTNFHEQPIPSLKVLTQAGGRLSRDKVLHFGRLAESRGWRFFVMYGQTEASPRMAYVPPHMILDHPDCIGRAIPGGELTLVDEQGTEILQPETEGELRYRGANVMLGYATEASDLARGRDTRELLTGDMACRTREGLFRITGRKSRFLKIFGLRIGLDDVERHLSSRGYTVACGGSDESLVVLTLDKESLEPIANELRTRFKLPASAFKVKHVDQFPLLPSGKVNYSAIASMAAASGPRDSGTHPTPRLGKDRSVLAIYQNLFPDTTVTEKDSFVSLGGDSLTFVEASMLIEQRLGRLPPGWKDLPVAALEQQKAGSALWRSVDVSSLLRCLAITAVVSNHFGLFRLSGAALFMFVIAGFNFARFQLVNVLSSGSTRSILSSALRVGVPTCLAIALLQAKSGDFDAVQLALLGNWTPANTQDFGFWFLELLVQLLFIVALILAFPWTREHAKRNPFLLAGSLLALTVATALVVPQFWSAEHLYNRVPHMLMWLFMLGWWIQSATQRWQIGAVVSCAIVLPVVQFGWAPGEYGWVPSPIGWMWVGCVALLFVKEVRVPYPLNRLVNVVAGASMFIFIVHFTARNLLHRLGITGHPALDVLAGIIGGVVAWYGWEHGTRYARHRVARWKKFMAKPGAPVSAASTPGRDLHGTDFGHRPD